MKPLLKQKPIRSKKIRNSARGETCTMNSPVCNGGGDDATVFCHSNDSVAGKGAGQKADDLFGFFGCEQCHLWFDQKQAASWILNEYEKKAVYRTQRRLFDLGLIIVK